MEFALEDERLLPASQMPKAENIWQAIQFTFWRYWTPFNPFFRDLFVGLGIVKHSGRQNYLLGYLKEGTDLRQLLSYLESQGFGNHFFAWKDDGEIVSLRRLDGALYQYHLRIFKDGEVRGHYEYTPETHPVMHLREIGFVEREQEFLDVLGDWITPARKQAALPAITRTLERSRS